MVDLVMGFYYFYGALSTPCHLGRLIKFCHLYFSRHPYFANHNYLYEIDFANYSYSRLAASRTSRN